MNEKRVAKTDRRIAKTKKIFRKALLSLMEKIPYNKITVTDICNYADVNRNTFYYHYENIDVLLNEIISSTLEDIRKSAGDYDDDISVAVIKQCQAYKKNADILTLLLVKNFNITFARQILDMDCMHSEFIIMQKRTEIDSETAEMISSFVSVGGLSIICKWLQNGLKQSPEEIGNLIYSLIVEGVNNFVQRV